MFGTQSSQPKTVAQLLANMHGEQPDRRFFGRRASPSRSELHSRSAPLEKFDSKSSATHVDSLKFDEWVSTESNLLQSLPKQNVVLNNYLVVDRDDFWRKSTLVSLIAHALLHDKTWDTVKAPRAVRKMRALLGQLDSWISQGQRPIVPGQIGGPKAPAVTSFLSKMFRWMAEVENDIIHIRIAHEAAAGQNPLPLGSAALTGIIQHDRQDNLLRARDLCNEGKVWQRELGQAVQSRIDSANENNLTGWRGLLQEQLIHYLLNEPDSRTKKLQRSTEPRFYKRWPRAARHFVYGDDPELAHYHATEQDRLANKAVAMGFL